MSDIISRCFTTRRSRAERANRGYVKRLDHPSRNDATILNTRELNELGVCLTSDEGTRGDDSFRGSENSAATMATGRTGANRDLRDPRRNAIQRQTGSVPLERHYREEQGSALARSGEFRNDGNPSRRRDDLTGAFFVRRDSYYDCAWYSRATDTRRGIVSRVRQLRAFFRDEKRTRGYRYRPRRFSTDAREL